MKYNKETKAGKTLIHPPTLDHDGKTMRGKCMQCNAIARRRIEATVIQWMRRFVQVQKVRKDGKPYEPYISYTAKVASCDDHLPVLSAAQKKELAISFGEGNYWQDGSAFYVRCRVFERQQVCRKWKKRSGKSRNWKTFRRWETRMSPVREDWVLLDVLGEYVRDLMSQGYTTSLDSVSY